MTRRDLIKILEAKVKSCEAEISNKDQWSILNKGRKEAYQDIIRVLNETN